MENRFNNRDFEQFVKQNADQYRMFPSEKIWDNIHTTLHVRRRWYGIGIAILLLVSVATVTLVMVNNSDKNQPIAQTLPLLSNKPAELNPAQETFIAPVKPSNKKTSSVATIADKQQSIVFLSDLSTQPVSAIEETATAPVLADNNIAETAPAVSVRQPETGPIASATQKKNIIINNNKPKQTRTVPAEPARNMFTSVTDNNNLTEPAAQPAEQKPTIKRDPNLLTIESVTNSYVHTGYSKKLRLQLSFTPTISYRDLKENKGFIRGLQAGVATPVSNVYVPDINSIVTHKPDLGFQLGLTAGYPLSKRLTLTGGLQFTVSKYDIKAYSAPREEATIALSAGGGTSTVSTFTSYRNIGGFRANWLRNLYVSASVPIGLEFNLISGKKGYIGVGSTVQPTYVLDNRSYLLSTDYKNYAEMPSLIRKWNINTSFEIFAASTSGKVKWKLGPQVRYQTMSSFKNKYPVKEHLFDFGLKLGIMLR